MFEKDKEEKELATNRLLDILRAQESGEVPKPEDKPIPIPIYREDKSRPGEEPVSSPVLKKDLKPTKEPLGIKKEKVEGVPKFEEISIDITQHKDLMSKEKPSGEVEKELEPEEFDGSLFSTMKDGIRKGSFTKGLSSIFHMFNESKRKITIYRSENHLRLLSIEYNYGECKIQRYAEYKLPYRAADKEIDDMDELTAYVFTREQNLSGKKVKYGALYSSKTLTRTNIIQTPKLKTKELTNMVQWSSKKNLPFAAEQAIVDWEVTPAAGEPSKNYVIIGVSERDSIERDLSIFSDNNMNARLISTLPVLLWKLFIYNYPDRKDGCYVLVHIGDTTTTISVVVKQTLLFTREIAIGAEDFYKAIIQRIVDKEKAIQIDHDLAEIILQEYGVAQGVSGIISGTGIDLYKISVFLRPVVERMSSELNRSLNYFKKQKPELEWD
ncbi:pilus assembly protein PilM, partial [bacterium]|nr:pilus assembly protein PilM [bacterium]